ncbi:hypothetical protein EOM57_00825 [Candidatus Saccharibacteria bacterium]|nr:hypothetical protein [Candidatus Saccharibacteria bacterium]
MELINSVARRSKIGEIGHIVLNLTLVVTVLVLVLVFNSPYLAYLALILSKWRIFAVRPRFWWTNLKSNLLDIMFGISIVTLIWQNSGWFSIQLIFSVVFALWVIFLKPLNKHLALIAQAGIMQFVALWALFTVAYSLPQIVVVVIAAVIGFVASHHVINLFAEEFEDTLLNLIWAFVVATLGWITWYWTIAYTPLRVPQISLLVTLLSFWALAIYQSLYRESAGQRVDNRALTAPTIFVLVGIVLLLVSNFFDQTSL